jgi:hypothetical protein
MKDGIPSIPRLKGFRHFIALLPSVAEIGTV